MTEQAEIAFARTFLNTLSTQPVTFGNDYQQPLSASLKRIPVFPIQLPPPPKRRHLENEGSSTSVVSQITLTFKSLKPPASYTLTVSPTDTIATIKEQLASSHPTAPPGDAQRLLVKGKALADTKLLKEYTVQDGDTVNLIVKPGVSWDPTKPKLPPSPSRMSPPSNLPQSSSPMNLSVDMSDPSAPSTPANKSRGVPEGRARHSRAPSIVLSPSPSLDTIGGLPEKDIVLTLDATDIPSQAHAETSSYHVTVADPEFWERLLAFLRGQFVTESDALTAFEDFLRASKGSLTASEIAKIRDHVGVMGMAGK